MIGKGTPEERARLRAFVADIKAACEKHGCRIYVADGDNDGLGFGLANETDESPRLVASSTLDDIAWWWEEMETRIAEEPLNLGGAIYWSPGVPPGTPYQWRATRVAPLEDG